MQTLNQHFISACQGFSAREAMRIRTASGWETFSYDDLLQAALKVAGWLKAQGLKPHDRAAIILDNSPSWSTIYFGILLAGGIVVPLDPQTNKNDIDTFLADSEAAFVFLEGRLAHLFQKDISRQKVVVLGDPAAEEGFFHLEELMKSQAPLRIEEAADVRENDTASIIYTSGTTSQPKGVELTHKNLNSNFSSIGQLNIVNEEDIFISILPLFHAYSFMATLILPLFTGAKIVYPNTLKSAELLPIIQETGVSVMVGVPELFYNIHRSIINKMNEMPFFKRMFLNFITQQGVFLRERTEINFLKVIYKVIHARFGSRLKYFVSGGARLDPQMAKDFYKFGFTILEGYGLTETAPIACLNPPPKAKPGSVGQPVPGVKVKIMNPDAGGIGEIAIQGPNVMKGYYQKPKLTKEVIKNGWFYSGDLGYIDQEGYVYISGRIKEVIVLGSGKNIFPEEVEKSYARSDFIKEIAVFLPPGEREQKLQAIIVPDFERFKQSGDVNVEEKIRWDIDNISKSLPSYKRIYGFVFFKEELPKTRLGKIKRYELALIYVKNFSKTEAKKMTKTDKAENLVLQTPIGEKVARFLEKELALKEPIQATDHWELDLGIDSLSRVELISGLEKMFQIHLSDQEVAQVATVADVVHHITNMVAQNNLNGQTEAPVKISWKDILCDTTDTEALQDVEIKRTLFQKIFGYPLRILIFLIFKIFCRMKVIGKENLVPEGPYIICCNHSSYLDAFAVIAGLNNHIALQTYFIGTKDIFWHPAVRWAIKLVRLIPIDSASELVKAMQIASHVVRNNKILCIFPEGQRSIDGTIKKFKKGIGILAKELDVPILPVAIHGTYEAWPRAVKYPKPHPVKVVFGKPVSWTQLVPQEECPPDEIYQVIAEGLQKEVMKLYDQASSAEG